MAWPWMAATGIIYSDIVIANKEIILGLIFLNLLFQ